MNNPAKASDPCTVTVNGTAITYASSAEAARQAAQWLRDAVKFARRGDGTYKFTVARLGRTYTILGHDSPSVLVLVQTGNRQAKSLTSSELRDLLAETA